MPIVNEVSGAFSGDRPHILYHGCPSSLPTRSCSARSTEALAARLSGAARVDVVENLVHAERVREPAQVERAQKAADRLLRLAQIGRHRCLAVARYAVVFERDLYVGRVRAGVDRDRERMDQFQVVGLEGETQPAAASLGPLVRRTGGGAQRDGRDRCCDQAGGRCLEKFFSVHIGFGWVVIGCRNTMDATGPP